MKFAKIYPIKVFCETKKHCDLAKNIVIFWKTDKTQIVWYFGGLNNGNKHHKNFHPENPYPDSNVKSKHQ